MKKASNDLEEIFLTLKDVYDEKLVLYEKIARISVFSRNQLCYNTFMTSLNEVVNVYKEVTIDNVISLNCDLRFVITLKANQKTFTLVALFNIQASISTKIALLRLLKTLIIKINYNFTFSTK
jgi:hypothetical protein